MIRKNCIACNNISLPIFEKSKVQYYQCGFCETVFSDPVPNDNMIGGGMEIERNTLQNIDRIKRFYKLCPSIIDGVPVLDYGCGHGMLVEDMKKQGIDCDGYDLYNPEYNVFKQGRTYGLVCLVETLEHIGEPFGELGLIYQSLAEGGICYIETGFVNIPEQDGIRLEDYFYIDASVGHSSIFSHLGLDIFMLGRGFRPLKHINRTVRVYQKV